MLKQTLFSQFADYCKLLYSQRHRHDNDDDDDCYCCYFCCCYRYFCVLTSTSTTTTTYDTTRDVPGRRDQAFILTKLAVVLVIKKPLKRIIALGTLTGAGGFGKHIPKQVGRIRKTTETQEQNLGNQGRPVRKTWAGTSGVTPISRNKIPNPERIRYKPKATSPKKKILVGEPQTLNEDSGWPT